MRTRTATRRPGLSSLLPAPRTFSSRTRRRSWRWSVSATTCGRRRGVPPGNPNTSVPASPPLVVWSDLGLIIRRRPPSPAPRRFSTAWHGASASAWPDPRGIISSTSMWRGGSLAPSGVAAAHAASCGARGARFCEPPRAGCAALGVAPFQVSGYAEPGGIEYIGAACRGAAGRPAYHERCGGIRLRYAQVAPRPAVRPVGTAPLQAPGAWRSALPAPDGTAPPRIPRRPPVRPRRARPSRLWGGPTACVRSRLPLPSVRRSCGTRTRGTRTCGSRPTWAGWRRSSFYRRRGRSCFWAGWACLSLTFCFFCSCCQLGPHIRAPFGLVRVWLCPPASPGVSVFGQGPCAPVAFKRFL